MPASFIYTIYTNRFTLLIKKCIVISVSLMLYHILKLFTNKPRTIEMLHYNMLLDMPHVYTRKKSPYFGRQLSGFII